MTEYKEENLQPGSECPKCTREIVTYWIDKLRNPDEATAEGRCALPADSVEPDGFTDTFAGNTIVIDHVGPQME